MKVLVACEYSGVVRDAFRRKGHDAWSCDIIPCDGDQRYHIQDDVFNWLNSCSPDCIIPWDMMIAHPPCTHLAVSGARYFKNKLRQQHEALEVIWTLMRAPIEKICLENPVSIISSRIRKPDQIIQPYEFGHDASKKTCLWLKGLPLLKSTEYVNSRIVDGKKRWGNQTDSGQNRLGPSETRAKDRARTYEGIAEAMADQWG